MPLTLVSHTVGCFPIQFGQICDPCGLQEERGKSKGKDKKVIGEEPGAATREKEEEIIFTFQEAQTQKQTQETQR